MPVTIDNIATFISTKLSEGFVPTTQQDLINSGFVNSLGVMRIVRFIEETESISIPAEDITPKNFANVAAISAYVRTRAPASSRQD